MLTATLSKTSGTYPLSLWFESPLGVWFAEGTTTGTLQATLTLDEQGVWTIYVGVSGFGIERRRLTPFPVQQ